MHANDGMGGSANMVTTANLAMGNVARDNIAAGNVVAVAVSMNAKLHHTELHAANAKLQSAKPKLQNVELHATTAVIIDANANANAKKNANEVAADEMINAAVEMMADKAIVDSVAARRHFPNDVVFVADKLSTLRYAVVLQQALWINSRLNSPFPIHWQWSAKRLTISIDTGRGTAF
jgi:hypothetical protein